MTNTFDLVNVINLIWTVFTGNQSWHSLSVRSTENRNECYPFDISSHTISSTSSNNLRHLLNITAVVRSFVQVLSQPSQNSYAALVDKSQEDIVIVKVKLKTLNCKL